MRVEGMTYPAKPQGDRPIFSERGVSFPQRDSVRPDTDQPGKREGQVGAEEARNQEAALKRSILKQQQEEKADRQKIVEHDLTEERDGGLLEKLKEASQQGREI